LLVAERLPFTMAPQRPHAALILSFALLVGCGGKAMSPKGDASVEHQPSDAGDAPADHSKPLDAGATADTRPDGGPGPTDTAPGGDGATDVAAVDAASDARDATPEVAPTGKYRALAVVSGRYHSCALMDDHKVKCWGDNGNGQLGLGDTKFRGRALADMGDALPSVDLGTGRTAKAIAAGREATCAILDTDDLKCWGMGQMLGLPSQENRGDGAGEMGDALPAINLGAGRKARRVAVSYADVCVERDDDKIRCWGLGGATTDVSLDGKLAALTGVGVVVMVVYEDGSVANARTPAARLTLRRPARSVSGADSGWCAVHDDASLECTNVSGAPSASARVSAIALTERAELSVLMPDGSVRAVRDHGGAFPWSKAQVNDATGGYTLQLGQPAATLTSGGYDHSCALLTDGSVKCWGSSPDSTEAAIGSGPDNGLQGTTWRAVELGARR
jgi:hypothetical protein